jgi:hypothetical protein
MFKKNELIKKASILIYLGFWHTTVTEKIITPRSSPSPKLSKRKFKPFSRGVSSLVVSFKIINYGAPVVSESRWGKRAFFVSTILQLLLVVVVVIVVLARTHARTDAQILVFSFSLMRFIALAVLAVFVVLLL